jgi:hypothetical protein
MVIRFFCKIHSYGKRETIQSDFSIGCGAQVAYQAAPKILDEIRSPFVVQTYSLSFRSHKMAWVAFRG